ncbi:DUF805 domain-containing protein [Chitiniphilus shinanonensis]|uniref:DUF805 domain-containing protein n=1 Tax=Chitiniphilus shinanonensis TaxID=553088 RepID=UPI003071B63E
MSNTVRLLLTGAILPGHTRESLLHQLGGLLKLERERVAELIDNAPTIIKQQLPVEHLDAYLPLLARTGAVVRVEHLDGRPYQPRRVAAPDAFPTLLLDDAPAPAPAPVAPPEHVDVAPAVAMVPVPEAPTEPPAQAVEDTMNCPGCGHAQGKRTLCVACGIDMPRFAAAQAQAKRDAQQDTEAARSERVRPVHAREVEHDCYETPALFGLSPAGRLGRMRYLAYSLVLMVALVPAILVLSLALLFLKGFWVVFGLAWTWMYLHLTVLRLHDLNLSGWWIAAGMVVPALVSLIEVRFGALAFAMVSVASLGLAFIGGSDGENRYGAPAEPPTLLINIVAAISLALTLLSLPWVLQSPTWAGDDQPPDAEELLETV